MKTIKNFKQLCSICLSNSVYSYGYDIQIAEKPRVVKFISDSKNMICMSILEDIAILGSIYSNFRYYVTDTNDGRLALVCYANFD